jgi:hypothetical protein
MTYYEIDPAVVEIARTRACSRSSGHAPAGWTSRWRMGVWGWPSSPDRSLDLLVLDSLQLGCHPGAPADAGGLRPLRTEAAAGCGDRRAHLERLPRPRARAGGPGQDLGSQGLLGGANHVGTSSRRRTGRKPSTWIVSSGDGGKLRAGQGEETWEDPGALPRGTIPRSDWTGRPLGPRSARSTGIEPTLPQHASTPAAARPQAACEGDPPEHDASPLGALEQRHQSRKASLPQRRVGGDGGASMARVVSYFHQPARTASPPRAHAQPRQRGGQHRGHRRPLQARARPRRRASTRRGDTHLHHGAGPAQRHVGRPWSGGRRSRVR